MVKMNCKYKKKYNRRINFRSKNWGNNLTKMILGIGQDKAISEFEKSGINIKTVRIKPNEMPAEHISFPSFKFIDVLNKDWHNSNLFNILNRKFFFVFYKKGQNHYTLEKVTFWNMPESDIVEARKVYNMLVDSLKLGKIVAEIKKNGQRVTHFPKSSQNRVCNVRPHATITTDTYKLPFPDKLTGLEEYTKHSFWLNKKYIKQI